MPTCPACQKALPDGSRWCSSCGTNLADGAQAPTATSASGFVTPISGEGGDQPRYIPGAVVDGRYRIVGLLGRGGMGDVYRADDLKLGQPVALKFLPASLDRAPQRLERFLNEVRTARKVSHPNVCRVYDIGEADGQHYLSMEYVDGEDLASLLQRIGRLPGERAVQVARQICAALAAAHEQGILHRDLKPANVMIDGRGRVRLTDFGLAGLAETIGGADIRSGTPGYMSPEQISGEGVSVKSDIYALGLVLYELFTGKAAFQADTLAELRDMHTGSMPSRPSSHVQELDPAVEQVVLRCLAKQPDQRPPTVLAVSAALPGGDPLAAALAAGDTPSPELVAEAGKREAMQPLAAIGLAVLALGLFLFGTRWGGTMSFLDYLPLDKRPEVQIDRAGEILEELGYVEPAYSQPVDHAWGMNVWNDVYNEVAEADDSADRWEELRNRPDVAAFWYRQSPFLIIPDPTGGQPVYNRGFVGLMNPPPLVAGHVTVLLDLEGKLRRLEVLPRRFGAVGEFDEPDWTVLFEMAGLDPANFEETESRYQRFFAPDHRRAWLGTRAERPDIQLRVEAGANEGRPTLFNIATEASMKTMAGEPEPSPMPFSSVALSSIPPTIILLILASSIVLVRRNLNSGRADLRGAWRFAVVFFTGEFLVGALKSHALFSSRWALEIWPLVAAAVFLGLIAWAMYVAAEPIGRQVWPQMFVSSSRLLSRPRVEWRDPLIGQSVLIGVIFGTIVFLIHTPIRRVIGNAIDGVPRGPQGYNFDLLLGQREALAVTLENVMTLGMSFVLVLSLVVLRLLIKRQWVAVGAAIIVWTMIDGVGSVESLIYGVIWASLWMVVLLRWGVVALAMGTVMAQLAWNARATDWSAWHAQGAVMTTVIVTLVVIYGLWASMGGQSVAVETPLETRRATSSA